MMAMTFFGTARWEDDVHPHESPKTMTIPMIILSIGSAFGGMVLLFVADIEHWLEPVVGFEYPKNAPATSLLIPVTVGVVLIGAVLGWIQYATRDVPVEAPSAVSWLTRAARKDLYGDTVNEAIFMRPGQYLTRSLVYVDNKVVDGAVNGTAALVALIGANLRKWQSGYTRSYALSMVVGVIVIAAIAVLVRMS
jgi:NADH-quinone oxidoreductase subunit L